MAEIDLAIRLANHVLDTPSRDPDDDLSMMSRQFLRARERIEALEGAYAELRHAGIPLARNADFYKPEVAGFEMVSVPLDFLRLLRNAIPGPLPSIEEIIEGAALASGKEG